MAALLGKLDRAELLARGTAEQKAASATLATEILQEVEPLLVSDAPVLEHVNDRRQRFYKEWRIYTIEAEPAALLSSLQ